MSQIVHTDQAPAAIGPYSQAVRSGNTVYFSGAIPLVPATGEVVEGDITAQAVAYVVPSLDELRAKLGLEAKPDQQAALQAVRDLVYELASTKDRDLAVDVLVHATGVAEFDHVTLRAYARRHGLSHEGFRKQVLAMQRRLNLPRRPMPYRDAN